MKRIVAAKGYLLQPMEHIPAFLTSTFRLRINVCGHRLVRRLDRIHAILRKVPA